MNALIRATLFLMLIPLTAMSDEPLQIPDAAAAALDQQASSWNQLSMSGQSSTSTNNPAPLYSSGSTNTYSYTAPPSYSTSTNNTPTTPNYAASVSPPASANQYVPLPTQAAPSASQTPAATATPGQPSPVCNSGFCMDQQQQAPNAFFIGN